MEIITTIMTTMMNTAIGIDIGGTSTKIGLVNQAGDVLAKHALPTQAYSSQEAFLTDISKTVFGLLTTSLNCDISFKGIGIGAPSGNYHTGVIADAANIDWAKDLAIVAHLKKEFTSPVVLTNDANAAALAERYYGAAKNIDHFASITLGTGLGCGIFSEGEIVHGAFGYAGEIGHSIAKMGGRPCKCGNHGCLETYVSATGVKSTYLAMRENIQGYSSVLPENAEDITAEDIAKAALKGDLTAKSTFEYTGQVLGWKLADLVLHTEPEAIFLVGGLANAEALIFEPTKKYMEENLLPLHKGKIRLLASELNNDEAGLLGAASLIWQQESKQQTSGAEKSKLAYSAVAS